MMTCFLFHYNSFSPIATVILSPLSKIKLAGPLILLHMFFNKILCKSLRDSAFRKIRFSTIFNYARHETYVIFLNCYKFKLSVNVLTAALNTQNG